MDFDYAHFALTEGRQEEAKEVTFSREAYNKALAETLNLNRTRILAFRNKPSSSSSSSKENHYSASSYLHQQQQFKPPRRIPQSFARFLEAPDIVDDFYLNLIDWSSSNILAIALENSVSLWNASTDSVTQLVRYEEEKGYVTSLNWAEDGTRLGVGLENGEVHIWEVETNTLERTLEGCCYTTLVGSLAWNSHVLTTGGTDGRILNNDVRASSHVVATYKGHSQEVCGLKWSGSGQRLASGGNDSLVHIWDRSSSTQWLHRLSGHTSAVKALAWCPFQSNLLASGGGGDDSKVKFWNIQTGACLNTVDTGSQVSSLLWSKNERELVGSCGCTVASAAADETLGFWNAFGEPGQTAKNAVPKVARESFSHVSRIR